MIKLEKLKPNPSNPRDISPDELTRLRDSINGFTKMMQARPIIVDENWLILAGHQRLKALQALDYKSIPNNWVKQVKDFTAEEKKEFIVRDNISNGNWLWDVFEDDPFWQDEPYLDWLGKEESDIDLDEFFKDPEGSAGGGEENSTIVLEYTQEDYDALMEKFGEMEGSKEQIVYKCLLGSPEEPSNILA